VRSRAGTLILAQNEFTQTGKAVAHLTVGALASKTIMTTNIITGVLSVTQENKLKPKAKFIVKDNADDS
jgi:hypothetical protein